MRTRWLFFPLVFIGPLWACTGRPCGDCDGETDWRCDAFPDDEREADGDGEGRDLPESDAPDVADEGEDAPDETGGELPPPTAIAIYDDTASPAPSAWAEGLEMIEELLTEEGFESRRVTRDEINDPDFSLDRFAVIVFGGGYSYPGYSIGITAAGKERLRGFVEAGGDYVGICAGGYFACDANTYYGTDYGDESGYDLDLFDGVCVGPIDSIAVYPAWGRASVLFDDHPAYSAELGPAPFTLAMWYSGGSYFEGGGAGVTVLGTYDNERIAERGKAAVVVREMGRGKVILTGVHPEVRWDGVSPDAGRLFVLLLRWAMEW